MLCVHVQGQWREEAAEGARAMSGRHIVLHGKQVGPMQMDQKHGLYFA